MLRGNLFEGDARGEISKPSECKTLNPSGTSSAADAWLPGTSYLSGRICRPTLNFEPFVDGLPPRGGLGLYLSVRYVLLQNMRVLAKRHDYPYSYLVRFFWTFFSKKTHKKTRFARPERTTYVLGIAMRRCAPRLKQEEETAAPQCSSVSFRLTTHSEVS